MRKKQGIFVLFLLCLSVLLGGCTAHTDYFEPFRGAFVAEVEGEWNGEPFSARLEEGALPTEGARQVTLTFYAPSGLSGMTVTREASGAITLRSGEVCVEETAAPGLLSLLDLFPTQGNVGEVTLTEEGYTKVAGEGFAVLFLADGTPYAIQTPEAEVTVVRFLAV